MPIFLQLGHKGLEKNTIYHNVPQERKKELRISFISSLCQSSLLQKRFTLKQALCWGRNALGVVN